MLILGPANCAKAGEVLAAFKAATPRGAVLVVPTALDAEHYVRELATGGALLGSVATFSGLTARIAARAGYHERRLSPLQRSRTLKAVVAATPLRALARSARSPGFAAATGHLVAELQRSLVSPEVFVQALTAWAQEDRRRGKYASDVGALYAGYAERLRALGRVDGELYAWRALDALRLTPESWGGAPVFFYGFDDLTALQRDAIETLSVHAAADVTVSLTYEAGHPALAARAETVEALRPLAASVRELPALDDHYAPLARRALHHLERSLFAEGSPPTLEGGDAARARVDSGQQVQLLEAGGERAEAELVAAEVRSRLHAGVPASEIVVVYRSLERAAALMAQVFSEYGIALAGARRVAFTHTPLGAALLALARCALDPEHARGEDLLVYLRYPGVLEVPERADRLELELRREGLRTYAQARARLDWELAEVDSLAGADDRAGELAAQANRLLSLAYGGSAAVLDGLQAVDAHALAGLQRALTELQELDEAPSGAELLELLEELEVEDRVAVGPDAVLLAEPLSIRARRFRCVFVCGLQEGEWPRPASPEPFLSDDARRELAVCAGLRLPRREDALERERYLFYSCVSRATDELVLSYRSSDEEGNLALPSPFIADVAQLLAADWLPCRRRRLLSDVVWPSTQAPTERERARALAACRAPAAGEEVEPERRLGEAAMARVRHRTILSGGALESYASCPVKWLVERELSPVSLAPDSESIVRGNAMHAALEELLRRLERPIDDESLPDAVEILHDVLSEAVAPVAAGQPESLRAAAMATIEADLRRYLEQAAADRAEFAPSGVELRFGFPDEPQSLPALEIGSGSEQIRVRGVIDRVDVANDGSRRAVVRDYKSGSARPEHQGARWGQDGQLQVALYMLAVRELLGLEPVAGLYQPLGGRDLRARGVYLEGAAVEQRLVGNDARSPQELEEVLADAAARALALAARLRAGEVTPCPTTCSRDGCRYPGICRAQ